MDLTEEQKFFYEKVIKLAKLMSNGDQFLLRAFICDIDNLVLSLKDLL